jgi:26S proteasome non-ATPase regulatory subunit 10
MSLAQTSTPTIHQHAFQGHYEHVQAFFSHSPIDVLDKDQRSALHWACSGKHLDLVRFLVEQGAEMDRQDESGLTSCMIAASVGALEIVQYLVSKVSEIE